MNMWDTIDLGTATRRESELRDTFWATILEGGSSMYRRTGTPESALQIVRSLITGFETKPRVVLAL